MFLENINVYDGSQLRSRFAYSCFKDKVLRTGNIIGFLAPMLVTEEHMVDQEDLINKDFIYSDKAINFLIEIPDISLFAGVCFQRLFNTQIANILSRQEYLNCDIRMKGDDIIVYKDHNGGGVWQTYGKASVSIAKEQNGAVLIHTGINIDAGKKAPAFAFSTQLSDQQARDFCREVFETFYLLTQDIFQATTKVIK